MQSLNALKLCKVLSAHGVEYMIIGKGAAILQGYSSTTQDIDIYPSKEPGNPRKLFNALKELGFEFDVDREGRGVSPSKEILDGKDFIQLKGPFELDIVFAPDGFESYREALPMKRIVDGLPVMSIDGIIRTKTAAGRKKDRNDLDDLRSFRDWLQRKGQSHAED